MTVRLRWVAALLVTLVVAACLGTTEPTTIQAGLQVDPITPTPAKDTAFISLRLIEGRMVLPDNCYSFGLTAGRSGTELTYTVTARATTLACSVVSPGRAYLVVVNDVFTPASYHVVVRHHTIDSRGDLDRVVADGTVVVGS